MTLDDQVELSQLILTALRQGGYVDPDDDTVPYWPRRSGRADNHCVWVRPTKLAADLVAALQPYVRSVHRKHDNENICTRCGLRDTSWSREFRPGIDEPPF